jgi:DNA-binding IclR family transcriptional regulator
MNAKVQGTQAFSRGIDLLQHIADRPAPPDLRDLLAECDYTRPTLYRLLAALEAEDLVVRTQGGRYETGPRLVNLARRALARSDIRELSHQALETLRNLTGETVHLAVPSGDGLVYINKIESPETVRMSSTIGTFVPLHSSGVGKAYLAALPPETSATLIAGATLVPITPFTTTDPAELQRQLQGCQADGYIFDDQENETGIVCFGAAILNEQATPVAAISVSVPLFRLDDNRARYSAPLLDCVRGLSAGLGYRG